jgi:hypothetical protein
MFCLIGKVMLFSQIGLVHGEHKLEFSGLTTMTFTNRDIISVPEKKLSYFDARNVQLRLEYNYRIIRCVVQADLAGLATGNFDPENIGLMNVWMQIKPVGSLKIRAGFFKVRYSRSNLISEYNSPFFNRSEVARGQVFGSRDFGLNLNYSFFRGLLNLNVGTYTGIAELSLFGKNALNTKFEYVARVDFSWPQKDKESDFDFYNARIPEFTVGANVRYNNKDATITDTYQLLVVGGKKLTHGYDAAFFYKGISIAGEIHLLKVYPLDKAKRTLDPTNNFFNAFGYYIQASYYQQKIKSFLAFRYDRMNQNTFYTGYGDRITTSIGSFFYHKHIQVRLNYTRIMSSEDIRTYNPPSWKNQWRVGIYYNL